MNATSNNWLAGAIGVLIGLAVVAAFLPDAPPATMALAQPLLDLGSLAWAVGEFTAVGFSLALLAFAVTRIAARIAQGRRLGRRTEPFAGAVAAPEVAAAVPQSYDATASELDDDAKLPAFAPVVSLTEAQVDRARAQQRQSERRAAPQSA